MKGSYIPAGFTSFVAVLVALFVAIVIIRLLYRRWRESRSYEVDL